MFTVATWNSNRGLGEHPSLDKLDFANKLSADLLIITDYGIGHASHRLGFSKTIVAERVLIGCKSGMIDQDAGSEIGLPTFVPFRWTSSTGILVKCVAAYAVTPIPMALSSLEKAIEVWGDWLRTGPALFLGDFNLWVGLQNASLADRSRRIHQKISSYGLQSAYHKYTGDEIGKEEHLTWEGSNGNTHIDFIFASSDMEIYQAVIEHPPRRARKYRDHSAVVATFKIGSAG